MTEKEKKESDVFEKKIDESEMEHISGGIICTGPHLLNPAPSCGKLMELIKEPSNS